jgi:hypothetical protein
MKKFFTNGVIWGIMLMVSPNVDAQINLGSLSNAVSNAASEVVSGQSSTTKDKIIGTWAYKRPAVVFNSNSLLKKAGGSAASSVIEKKLQNEFATVGITADKMKLTFGKTGKFSGVVCGKNISGTYALSGSNITLNFQNGIQSLSATTQMQSGDLELVFNSTKLLKFMTAVGKLSTNSTVSTISSIAGSYDGMQTGMRFSKSK